MFASGFQFNEEGDKPFHWDMDEALEMAARKLDQVSSLHTVHVHYNDV